MIKKILGMFSKDGDTQPLLIDRSLGYARKTEFVGLLQKGQSVIFEEQFLKLEPDAKTLLLDGIAYEQELRPEIARWAAQSPTSWIALLLAGVAKTAEAYSPGGNETTVTAADNAGEEFDAVLEEAFDLLAAADELNPEEPEIGARMIKVCTGLAASEEDCFSYFDAVKQTDPDHLLSHLNMIEYLSPQWHGGLPRMNAFANSNYANSNHALMVLLPLKAMVEEQHYYTLVGDEEKADAFFKKKFVSERILHLHKTFAAGSGELMEPLVHNYFAYLLFKIGEAAQAKAEVEKVGANITEFPWSYIGVRSAAALANL